MCSQYADTVHTFSQLTYRDNTWELNVFNVKEWHIAKLVKILQVSFSILTILYYMSNLPAVNSPASVYESWWITGLYQVCFDFWDPAPNVFFFVARNGNTNLLH